MNDTLNAHAVMFHHFHDLGETEGQGSISKKDFYNMIVWLKERYNLLSADEFTFRQDQKSLGERDICLTFDDALLCQYEIAVPILIDLNVRAFFFVYSSPFCGYPDPLEVYRYFRVKEFSQIDHFYTEFDSVLMSLHGDAVSVALREFKPDSYLSAFPFYSRADKWFRFLRDQVLTRDEYDEAMSILMKMHNFEPRMVYERLWMSETHLKSLANAGHVVGLHSYSHPTTIQKMSIEGQQTEYERNFQHLYLVIGEKPFAMAHPCGNYNRDTLKVLRRLGIKIGFRCNTSIKIAPSSLEIPREDHANIMKQMQI